MSIDYFLKLDPAAGIKGESTSDRHLGEIEILSWSFGASNTASFNTGGGGGGGAGKVSMSDLSLTKRYDLASPGLLQWCVLGKRLPGATLTARKAGGDPLEFLTVTLTDVVITSVQDAGSTSDIPTESVSMAFARIKFDYGLLAPNGAMTPGSSFGWDLSKNVKL